MRQPNFVRRSEAELLCCPLQPLKGSATVHVKTLSGVTKRGYWGKPGQVEEGIPFIPGFLMLKTWIPFSCKMKGLQVYCFIYYRDEEGG